LTVLDFATFPPASRMIRDIPVTVIGPPTGVAFVPGSNRAVVTHAMSTAKEGEAFKHVPRTGVSLVDLGSSEGAGRVLARAETGLQPTGISVRRDGRVALIANRAEGTLSVVAIGAEPADFTEKARVKIATPADSLAHVEISPDGALAVVSLSGAAEPGILLVELDAEGMPAVLQRIPNGKTPYAVRFLPDGSGFFVADVGAYRVSLFTVADKRATLTEVFEVGRIPEGLEVSADGEWVAASCFEGANLTDKADPKYGQQAKIYLLRRQANEDTAKPGAYRLAGTIPVKGAPQFAVFSGGGRYLTVSTTSRKEVGFFRREGGGFVDTGLTQAVEGEPVGAAATR
jgi:DNA-binding beta-propeller fold protein YncE